MKIFNSDLIFQISSQFNLLEHTVRVKPMRESLNFSTKLVKRILGFDAIFYRTFSGSLEDVPVPL